MEKEIIEVATEYNLWKSRAKKHDLTPLWTGAVTLIFAPLGYWLVGEGVKGLKYTIIIFFAGYISLGLATFIGSIILTINVNRKARKNEHRFKLERKTVEKSKFSMIIKIAILILLIFFTSMTILFFSIT